MVDGEEVRIHHGVNTGTPLRSNVGDVLSDPIILERQRWMWIHPFCGSSTDYAYKAGVLSSFFSLSYNASAGSFSILESIGYTTKGRRDLERPIKLWADQL